jgi:hypothetical protein
MRAWRPFAPQNPLRIRVGAASDLEFSGWYVQGSWVPTGEERRWSAATGGLGGLRPARPFDLSSGAWGAWEQAACYSVLDLDDDAGVLGLAAPSNGVRGGVQEITILGLNWFSNCIVRFQSQAQDVGIDSLNPGTVVLATVGAQIGQDYGTIAVRSQLAFLNAGSGDEHERATHPTRRCWRAAYCGVVARLAGGRSPAEGNVTACANDPERLL